MLSLVNKKDYRLALYCHVRPLVPPVILGFNQENCSEYNVPTTDVTARQISTHSGQSVAELLTI